MRLIDYKAILLTLDFRLEDKSYGLWSLSTFFTLSFDDSRYVKDFVFKRSEDFNSKEFEAELFVKCRFQNEPSLMFHRIFLCKLVVLAA